LPDGEAGAGVWAVSPATPHTESKRAIPKVRTILA
jgi:hypothetical protein